MSAKSYNILVLFHLLLGVVIYLFEPLSKVYFFCVLGILLLWVIQKGNKNDEVLFAAAYITGFEVLSRMTGAAFTYEFAKYAVMFFLLLGMFYRGIQLKSWPYFVYMLLLLPGVIFSVMNLSYETNVGNAIGFNLSGPVTLGVSAMYCYNKKMPIERLHNILFFIILPILSTTVYIYLYTPSIRDVVTGTESNFATSGGYGPNQVATVLGFAAFVLFARLLLFKNKKINLIELGLLGFVLYRAVVTFSRGGVIVAAVCSVILLLIYYYRAPLNLKMKLIPKIGIMIAVIASTWVITTVNTSGLIVNRYANQDAAGRENNDLTTGRLRILNEELAAFYEHPITGLGIGKAKEYRLEVSGHLVASHNELSRLLSEHGMFGVLALLILFITPLIALTMDRSNILMLSFLVFWFLTISHSSMRLAMPALIYGLCLLQIQRNGKKSTLSR